MNKLTKLAVCVAVSISGAGVVSSANAAAATTTIPVTATVVQSCTITSDPIPFGNYNGISGALLDVAATMSPTCTSGTAYSIGLNGGVGVGATAGMRKLSGPGSSQLNYSIYSDAARTIVWGDGSFGTVQNSGVGNGAVAPTQMYGRIPASQNSPAGAYSDTLTVTLTY